jgi:hypothetical protein
LQPGVFRHRALHIVIEQWRRAQHRRQPLDISRHRSAVYPLIGPQRVKYLMVQSSAHSLILKISEHPRRHFLPFCRVPLWHKITHLFLILYFLLQKYLAFVGAKSRPVRRVNP